MAASSRFPSSVLATLALLLYFVALFSIATAEDPLLSVYDKWISDFGRAYKSDAEKQQRFEVFKANFQFIESLKSQPDLTYTVSLNEFADLTNEEFLAKYTGFKSASGPKKATHFKYANLTTAPTCVDWRSSGAVTPVKNQGNCGITTESDYPYTSGSTGSAGTCNYPKTYDYAVSLLSYQDVTANCESCLKNAVANQPVSVAIDASGSAFQFYSSGIFTGPCGTNLDHGVLVVGYGPCSTGTAYWIVKNSWGTSWGESGYIRMQRYIASTSGPCGIAMEPSYPTM
ncbi:hypothetical protein LUZ61_018239 [Rhynchospora tenuis]|uniref:Uncharacterized protein n=1 Tax=Rhynchospora tenuis TaxID=198213 RepID=A0AAD5Z920_9POAL|nr:hypothetical protein LUZ61_018238 [Rhynchospora tenuis]KAJ3689075.1 hypothetical protein LUZ61_018239 [Rhynchospora tenuis]